MATAEPFVLIGQLTDTHVVALDADGNSPDELYVDNNARLAAAVASINAETPALDVLLGTGDLTNGGRPAEYDNLAALLAPLTMRFLPIPGNHDDRELLRATFPDVGWVDAAHASWVTTVRAGDGVGADAGDADGDDAGAPDGDGAGAPDGDGAGAGAGADAPVVRVVGLDSTVPGQPGAEFDVEREAWLRAVLDEDCGATTLLAMHHPPFATGVGWMDRSGFVGLDRLAALLASHPVDRIVCGHFHRPVSSTIAGITAQVGLSTVQHVDLDLAPDAGVSLIVDPIGYQIHRVAASGIVAHTRYIRAGDGVEVPSLQIIPGWA